MFVYLLELHEISAPHMEHTSQDSALAVLNTEVAVLICLNLFGPLVFILIYLYHQTTTVRKSVGKNAGIVMSAKNDEVLTSPKTAKSVKSQKKRNKK